MSTLDSLLNTRPPKMGVADFRAACSRPDVAQPTTAGHDLYSHLLEKYGAIMTVNDAGEVLHRHPSHIRQLCRAGELPAVLIGKRWHISTAKLAALLEGVAIYG